jgi:hypothetical protein
MSYIIAAQVESFKVYWTGVEWTYVKSQAKQFETRIDANRHRDASADLCDPLTISFLKVEHG